GYLNSAGHPDQALLAARHAVEVDPKFPDSYFNLSVAYQERARLQSDPRQKSSDYAEAIQAAQRSVQLGRPHEVASAYQLGMLYKESGDFLKAADIWAEITHHNPEFRPVWGQLGMVLASQQKWGEALAALQKATELDPQDGASWNNLAFVLRNMGRETEAMDAFRRAQALGVANAQP